MKTSSGSAKPWCLAGNHCLQLSLLLHWWFHLGLTRPKPEFIHLLSLQHCSQLLKTSNIHIQTLKRRIQPGHWLPAFEEYLLVFPILFRTSNLTPSLPLLVYSWLPRYPKIYTKVIFLCWVAQVKASDSWLKCFKWHEQPRLRC